MFVFAHAKSIVNEIKARGMKARGFDIDFHEDLDLSSAAGFLPLGYIVLICADEIFEIL